MDKTFKQFLEEQKLIDCPMCNDGYDKEGEKCPVCKGKGEASATAIDKANS